MKYPIGIQRFDEMINDAYTYVDKTDLVYSLVTEGKIYFLSRPRRFGKSLLISTLKAYFEGRKELFAGLKIDELEHEWKIHHVFRFDFNGRNFAKPGSLERRLNLLLTEWEKEYGIITEIPEDYGDRLSIIFKAAYNQTGRGAVVLVDEYDKPLLDILEKDPKLVETNRDILQELYSSFKFADDYIHFVFLTGITKFSQVSVFSGFNQPIDISMDSKYDALCGITEKELHSLFCGSIRKMAESNGCTFEEMSRQLKKHYDGYHFSRQMTDIYNPFSLFKAFHYQTIDDYWFSSGNPSYLVRLMNHTNVDIDDLINKSHRMNSFMECQSDKQQSLPMLYQSGYLTIKDFDQKTGRYHLDFPNNEVKRGFLDLLASNYLHTDKTLDSLMADAVEALDDGELGHLFTALNTFFASVPYTMRRKENERERERDFQYTFYLILFLMSTYRVLSELQQSEGRVDCVVETPKYVYIFEFKLDASASKALEQIEEKGYARPYESDSRKVIKVGVNFSSKTGTIDEWLAH